MPTVSVIIPTRNRASMVRTAIESVLAQQNEKITLEVIVIDDGSTDNTIDTVKALPIVFVQGRGEGVSAARNLGLEVATGEYIAFLDDDDAWNDGYPGPQLAFLEKHPDFGAVISQIMMADEELRPTAGPYPDHDLPSGWIFEALFHYVPGVASMIVRTSVVRQIGGFDPLLHGAEDWDWSLKIARQYQIGFVPEVSMIVRQHTHGRVFGKSHGEDAVLWRRYIDTMRVYRRHSRHVSGIHRLRLQRRFWGLRGWFVPFFMQMSSSYLQKKQLFPAMRCLTRALQASPVHTALFCYRSVVQAVH